MCHFLSISQFFSSMSLKFSFVIDCRLLYHSFSGWFRCFRGRRRWIFSLLFILLIFFQFWTVIHFWFILCCLLLVISDFVLFVIFWFIALFLFFSVVLHLNFLTFIWFIFRCISFHFTIRFIIILAWRRLNWNLCCDIRSVYCLFWCILFFWRLNWFVVLIFIIYSYNSRIDLNLILFEEISLSI